MKNDLSFQNVIVEDATELALDLSTSGGYWQQTELCSEMMQAER